VAFCLLEQFVESFGGLWQACWALPLLGFIAQNALDFYYAYVLMNQ
jgi:hypothetical protein